MDDLEKNGMDQLYAEAYEALNTGKFKEAISSYLKIVSVFPDDIAALNNLGLALLEEKQYDVAMETFEHAASIDPNIAQLHYNLGLCLHKQGRFKAAVASYQKAVSLDGEYKEPLQNMGAALKRTGDLNEAASCYKRLLELDPGDANAAYMLDTLSGTDRQKASPREFVTGLFDDYADHFENQLVGKLAYQIPVKLKQAFVSVLGDPGKFENLLDLGCGTGLVAEAFQDFARCMAGVDLSEKMLEQASKKKMYTQLFKADIRAFLKHPPNTYDLVIAADVLIYLGRLDDIFSFLAKGMAKGGYLLFSTEDNPDIRDFSLLQSGRYGHGPMYVQSVALKNEFQVRLCRPAGIRKEQGKWLRGNIFILEFMGKK